MEWMGPLLELVKGLWGLARKPLGYVRNLKANVNLLQEKTQDLKDTSEAVKSDVEREEGAGDARRTEVVARWLEKVPEFEGRVVQVLEQARGREQCVSRCLPQNCWSSYKLGKTVEQLLNEARELGEKGGNLGHLTSPLPPPPVLEKPVDETLWLDISLKKVLKWLVNEEDVRTIGLYGTGGVGKTTLMKSINNELFRTNHGFEVVIWVVVSRQVNEDNIQDEIRKRLRIPDDRWNQYSREDKEHCVRDALTRRKFVLLIDDVWRRLDLSNIGVPYPDRAKGSKVVFTTRSQHVCDQMKVEKKLEVQCLKTEAALKLFERKVGKSLVDFDQEIQGLAKDIAVECKGLPLALVTVGRAMAGKHNASEWRHALRTLRDKPHKLQGMVDEVYHTLKFSYNSLNDPTRQDCFLYCCLFPEDYHIRQDGLIQLWIGEGLLGDANDVYGMGDEGESVLRDLTKACLLESGVDDVRERWFIEGRGRIKAPWIAMHDVIRDMATWIARDHGQSENKILVIEKEEELSPERISKWGEAKKVSIWGRQIENIDRKPPTCSQLKTLIVRETRVSLVPEGFFNSMKTSLTVLDLSDNMNIESFPEEICNLIELQHLNLSRTRIHELPEKIKNLTRLRLLLLDGINGTFLIPTGAIASLPLHVFSYWDALSRLDELCPVNEEDMIEELGNVQHLTDLSIRVFKSSSARKIFQSPNFRRRIRRAGIGDCEDLTGIEIRGDSAGSGGGGSFSQLEELLIVGCDALRKIDIDRGVGRAPISYCFPSLVRVTVQFCTHLKDLSWLLHAPNLQDLRVGHCKSMEKIIGDGFTGEELAASRLFSRLQSLELSLLPKLRSICDQTLSFPQRVFFHINECPGLTKLPLDSNSTRGRIFRVTANDDWWERFEWDPAARVTLSSDRGPDEEMTFREAVRKLKDGTYEYWITIVLGP